MPKYLHAYWGANAGQKTTRLFARPEWEGVKVRPEALLERLPGKESGEGMEAGKTLFDAVFIPRCLGHLYQHEVETALAYCLQVLKPDGHLVVIDTDIGEVCSRISRGALFEKAYDSPAGAVTLFDLLYGFRPALAEGKPDYARRSGFTARSLGALLAQTGFSAVWTSKNPATFTLLAVASKNRMDEGRLKELAGEHFN